LPSFRPKKFPGVSLKFGAGPATATNGIILAAGEVYIINIHNNQEVHAIALVGTPALIINENQSS